MLAPHLLLKPSASVNTCEPSRVARLSDLLLHYFHYLIWLLRKTFIITELGIKELAQRGGSGVLLGSICGSREVFFSRRSHLQGKVKIEPVRGVEGMKGGVNIHPVLFVSVAVVGSSPKIHIRAGLCLQETTEQRGLEGNADWSCWFKIYLFNTCSDGEQRQNTDSKQEEVGYLSPPREKRANVSVKNTQDGNVGQTEAFQQNVCATTGQIIRKLSSVIFFFILVTVWSFLLLCYSMYL